jgi:hypothetical protein
MSGSELRPEPFYLLLLGTAELGPDAFQCLTLVNESLILLIVSVHLIGGLVEAVHHRCLCFMFLSNWVHHTDCTI